MNAIVRLNELYRLLDNARVDSALIKSLSRSVNGLWKANKFLAFVAGGAFGLGVCAAMDIAKLTKRIEDLEARLEGQLDNSKEDDCK